MPASGCRGSNDDGISNAAHGSIQARRRPPHAVLWPLPSGVFLLSPPPLNELVLSIKRNDTGKTCQQYATCSNQILQGGLRLCVLGAESDCTLAYSEHTGTHRPRTIICSLLCKLRMRLPKCGQNRSCCSLQKLQQITEQILFDMGRPGDIVCTVLTVPTLATVL